MAPLFMTGIINSVLFGVQFNLVHTITSIRGASNSVGMSARELQATSQVSDMCLAAVLSGGFISLLVTPVEGIKARLQVQYAGNKVYLGPIDCAKKVYKNLGLVKGIYRGWFPVCLCRMSNYSYFGSYAFITQGLRQQFNIDAREKLPIHFALVSGGSAGICYWLSWYPIDVIKNRMQGAPDISPPRYNGFVHAVRTIYAKEGWRAFFAGFTPCAMREFPANAATFVGFEMALRILPESLY